MRNLTDFAAAVPLFQGARSRDRAAGSRATAPTAETRAPPPSGGKSGFRLADRLFTIIVTATLTSAAWIVVGASLFDVSFRDEPVVADKAAPPIAPASAAAGSQAGQGSPVASTAYAPASSGLVIPVVGITPDQLTDSFTDARGDGARSHQAIDIMAPRGTRVLAAAPGTVARLLHSDDGGNTIYIRSADRRSIDYYAHLDRYAPGLEEGEQVRRGEYIGNVGSTGNASPDAPHLHFAIMRTTPDAKWYDPSTAVDPYPLLTGR